MGRRRERVIIVGGGISGLAAAGFLAEQYDCLLVERESELGGYCRTIYQDGFTWDYSGHFFHFRHKWIADYVHAALDASKLLEVDRLSKIYLRRQYVDYPFQFNVHQLPLPEFVRCITDMYNATHNNPDNFSSFREMVYGRYGRSISELFLIPYNEKLYSLSADKLDAGAMGRFFPHVEFGGLLERIGSALSGDDTGRGTYNAQFCYHKDGAKAYVDALASYVPDGVVRLSTTCEAIDPIAKTATISGERIPFDRLIISAPLPNILALAGVSVAPGLLTANKVLVFNLGFDRPSLRPDHWVYYPEPEWTFFRVGHYDNILGEDRMSLYVEVAMSQEAEANQEEVLARVLADLKRSGVVRGHNLVSWAAVMLDPAYVHITQSGQQFATTACEQLRAQGIMPIGRYGRWTYCSIEDNIVEAYNLARDWGGAAHIAADNH